MTVPATVAATTEMIADFVMAMFERRELDTLAHLLADNVELRPPTYGRSWRGKQLVGPLLSFAAQSFDELRYTDRFIDSDRLVLRFEAIVDGQAISGVDMIRVDKDGHIDLFEIFSRPPKVALTLLDRMTERVRAAPDILAMMKDTR